MSVTNSPASAILRGRRLSSRRPSGRRASSSCDCCPSREPDEWTEWTTWVGQRRSAGLRSGVGRQSSKDVCVFLAPTRANSRRAASYAAHTPKIVQRHTASLVHASQETDLWSQDASQETDLWSLDGSQVESQKSAFGLQRVECDLFTGY